jgi:site-specific recombinase XerC
LQEPLKPGSKDKMALCPLALLSSAHVKMLRDRKADKPDAANNRLKYLSSMFSWAVERDPPLLRSNPARDVKTKKYATEGFHSWTADEVQQFEEHHPIGSKPRLAFALMYYLGVRLVMLSGLVGNICATEPCASSQRRPGTRKWTRSNSQFHQS